MTPVLYLIDLSLCDFLLFPKLKNHPEGKRSNDDIKGKIYVTASEGSREVVAPHLRTLSKNNVFSALFLFVFLFHFIEWIWRILKTFWPIFQR